jgi:hypothetical protein
LATQRTVRIADFVESIIIMSAAGGEIQLRPRSNIRLALRDALDGSKKSGEKWFEKREAAADDGNVELEHGPNRLFGARGCKIISSLPNV